MAFDIDKLSAFAVAEISKFASKEKHNQQTYYAFAIEGSYLWINSLENYEKGLEKYINSLNDFPYLKKAFENDPRLFEDEKLSFKENTAEWMSVADFNTLNKDDEEGYPSFGPFDNTLYAQHYNLSVERQKTSEYAKAIDAVLKALVLNDAFKNLKRTPNFLVRRADHTY